jgi:glycosyltransferase involved in cell wall biosynthesis
MAVQPAFSIITASMGRLDHLRLSLPLMLAQPDSEVIVVDYSCPDGTGDFVREHFPSVTVIAVDGERFFSNWRARNAGAAVARGKLLLFCDADTILAENATGWIADHFDTNSFGLIDSSASQRSLAANQLKGFQLVPRAAFRSIGGYDEILTGYAAGGDVDLAARLRMAGLNEFALDSAIIGSVVDHGDAERMRHQRDPIAISYAAGLLYRSAKYYVLRLTDRPEIALDKRQALYAAAREAANSVEAARGPTSLCVDIEVDVQPVGMPRQLGFARGTRTVTITVEIALEGRLADIE